jgi:hypothetical protein
VSEYSATARLPQAPIISGVRVGSIELPLANGHA